MVHVLTDELFAAPVAAAAVSHAAAASFSHFFRNDCLGCARELLLFEGSVAGLVRSLAAGGEGEQAGEGGAVNERMDGSDELASRLRRCGLPARGIGLARPGGNPTSGMLAQVACRQPRS
jgi:hypothetical protein